MIDPTKIKKVWIIAVSTIGDMVINIPMFKKARETFPHAKIYLISWTYIWLKLIEKCPYIDGIISESPSVNIWKKIKFLFRIFRERFDVVLTPWGFNLGFLTSLFSWAKYRVWYVENRYSFDRKVPLGRWTSNIKVDYKYSRYLSDKKNEKYDCVKYIQEILSPFWKRESFNDKLEIFMDFKKEQKVVEQVMKTNQIDKKDKIVCIHLWGMKENRDRCRETKKWIETLQFILKNYNSKICFIWGKDNSNDAKKIIHKLWKNKNAIDLTDKLSLSQSVYLINECSLFLCTDSWPMNIAIGLQKKVIALLWPVTPVIDKYIYYPIRKDKISNIQTEEVISAIKKSL